MTKPIPANRLATVLADLTLVVPDLERQHKALLSMTRAATLILGKAPLTDGLHSLTLDAYSNLRRIKELSA